MNNDMDFNGFGCEEILTDALITQKYISQFYCSAALECSDVKIKNTFMSIQEDEQLAEQELFAEMQKHGWYQVKKASENDIKNAKTAILPENNG